MVELENCLYLFILIFVSIFDHFMVESNLAICILLILIGSNDNMKVKLNGKVLLWASINTNNSPLLG